ncbi:hypothetical protein TWF225_006158 [Orbilia oligospora]|nr:hypothetical protein TWF225_006158 [Orbilia oligospora]KAF3247564.1 hypothetical protein TWF128_008633 [Orbilia oligospora]KAF3250808.1 hypothetical protein TWF217_008425 [Orbilia oligospora]
MTLLYTPKASAAPSRAAVSTIPIKRYHCKTKPKVLIAKPVGMTIRSLPMEIQEKILGHLLWYDHFAASMVCPEWAALLQLPKFRRKRYCIETWTELEDERSFLRLNSEMEFQRYHPGETGPKDSDGFLIDLGMHGLLSTGTMVLSIRETGEARIYLAIRQFKESWKGKAKGEYVGPMTVPYEKMATADIAPKRSRTSRDTQKIELSFHDITDSPLLATDTQFYYGADTNEKVPDHVQAMVKMGARAKYWANGYDTWKEIKRRGDDISVRILDREYLTDGISSHSRNRCEFEDTKDTTIPGVLPISSMSITTGTTIQDILEGIKEALTDEQDLDGLDGPLECWATFQDYCHQKAGENGPEDVDLHPRRKIFLSLWNLSRCSLDMKKGYVDCGCDGTSRHCACHWDIEGDERPWYESEMLYRRHLLGSASSDEDEY